MNLKQLVDSISAETELPAGVVRKGALSMLKKFVGIIKDQTNFVSPVITLTSVTAPAKPATDKRPALPERKFARMAIRPKKEAAGIN